MVVAILDNEPAIAERGTITRELGALDLGADPLRHVQIHSLVTLLDPNVVGGGILQELNKLVCDHLGYHKRNSEKS